MGVGEARRDQAQDLDLALGEPVGIARLVRRGILGWWGSLAGRRGRHCRHGLCLGDGLLQRQRLPFRPEGVECWRPWARPGRSLVRLPAGKVGRTAFYPNRCLQGIGGAEQAGCPFKFAPMLRDSADIFEYGNEDPLVRQQAARGLARFGAGASRAIPDLAKAVMDSDVGVQKEAAVTLGILGNTAADASPYLIHALFKGGEEVRLEAARALGNIGLSANESIPYLLEATKDNSPRVRRMVYGALVLLGFDHYDTFRSAIRK